MAVYQQDPTLPELYERLRLHRGGKEVRIYEMSRENPLRGTLEVINLRTETKAFDVLSYVWTPAEYHETEEGSQKKPVNSTNDDLPEATISVHTKNFQNGQTFRLRITKNCESALRHLHKIHRDKNDYPMRIWVDQLCLDQGLLHPKSRDKHPHKKRYHDESYQFELMCHIYSIGRMVYIWLGEPKTSTSKVDKAMQFLANGAMPFKYLVDYRQDQPQNEVPFHLNCTKELLLALYILCNIVCLGIWKPHYEELDRIFRNVWIDRLWTFQEAVIPVRSTIVYGHSQIPWRSMLFSLEFIRFQSSNLDLLFPSLKFPLSFQGWDRLKAFWLNHPRIDHDKQMVDTIKKDLESYRIILRRVHRMTLAPTIVLWLISAAIGIIAYLQIGSDNIASGLTPWFFVFLIGVIICVFLIFIYIRLMLASRKYASNLSFPHNTSESILKEICRRTGEMPEDKYWGTLGMLKGIDYHETDTKRRTLPELYQKLTISLLEYTKSLGPMDVLLLASHNSFGNKKVPSWVVNWEEPASNWLDYRYRRTKNGTVVPRRKTGGASFPDIMGQNPREQNQTYPSVTAGSFPWWVEGADSSLTLQGVFLGKLVLQKKERIVEMLYQEEKGAAEAVFDIRNYQQATKNRNSLKSNGETNAAVELVQLQGRLNETHVGVAHIAAQPEDVVALISGVSMPLVLRETKAGTKRYNIIGPAFLPRLLYGTHWSLYKGELISIVVEGGSDGSHTPAP